MRIAYIVPSLIQEGIVTVAYDLAKVMTKNGHNCEVFYFDERSNIFNFPCPTYQIPFNKSIDFNAYDVIHSHGLRPDMYVAKHKPSNCKAKCVTTSHNFMFADLMSDHGYLKGILGGIVWLWSWRKLDSVVVLTDTALNYYKKLVNPKKLAVVYNTREVDHSLSIEPDDASILSGLKARGFKIIGSICRVTDRKGLIDVVRALPYLDGYRFVVVGDGHGLDKLKAEADSMGVTDKMVYLGNRKDGHRYLPYLDVVCMPSRSEGFPLVLLEAATYKKAVVTSDIPIYKEVFSEEEIIACDSKNPKVFAECIMDAYDCKELMGANLYDRYLKNYSPEIFYQDYLNVYRQR